MLCLPVFRWTLWCSLCVSLVTWNAATGNQPAPVFNCKAGKLKGGAAEVFGGIKKDVAGVNYVYAKPTGGRSTMRTSFSVSELPAGPLFLHMEGCDDDFPSQCPIEVTLNGVSIVKGPSEYTATGFSWKKYPLPKESLKVGDNELVISNTAAEGTLGMPPWFMVAGLAIGVADCDVNAPPALSDDFFFRLPDETRPLPEPPKESSAGCNFKVRGTKGWMWSPDQYLSEIPVLAKYKLNFLMLCYGSMWDLENHRNNFASGEANRWWEPLPPAKKKAYEGVVKACQAAGVEFCFAMNPVLFSKRPLDYHKAEDIDQLWQHYAWMADLGVNWFSICLDDISTGIEPSGQAKLCNDIFNRLRKINPKAQFIFCPTFYWDTGDDPKASEYLAVLDKEMDREIYCFWTGDGVVGRITRRAAQKFRDHAGHRLVIWDNYPVNDAQPTLHLGPVTGRDPDLCAVADGYMSNPLCPQNEINRIPLLTIADYAYNPADYDPRRSIGQAIRHLADTQEQREALRSLVELYPGMLVYSQGTGWNPLIHRFIQILQEPHDRPVADAYLAYVEGVAQRMKKAFPDRYRDAQATLEGNIQSLKAAYREKFGS